jgi:hypothetical protein
MESLLILPQNWAEKYVALPSQWLRKNATSGLFRAIPDIDILIDKVAKEVGIDPRLLVTRMQLEQSAVTYAWDGSDKTYSTEGVKSDYYKKEWLCGVDKPNPGPEGGRPGAWRGPERQLYGCALRFKYWYRGKNGPKPEWKNHLGLSEDPRYKPGVAVTRSGQTIVPENQISADCLRYTASMGAQYRLKKIAESFFPETPVDPIEESQDSSTVQKAIDWMIDNKISDGSNIKDNKTLEVISEWLYNYNDYLSRGKE